MEEKVIRPIEDVLDEEEDPSGIEDLPWDEEVNPVNYVDIEIKPCYNYQSITVKTKIDEDNLLSIFELYKYLLEELKKVTDEVLGDEDVNFVPATEKQKEIMDKYRIVYPKKCSNEQAQKLIEKSIAKKKR